MVDEGRRAKALVIAVGQIVTGIGVVYGHAAIVAGIDVIAENQVAASGDDKRASVVDQVTVDAVIP